MTHRRDARRKAAARNSVRRLARAYTCPDCTADTHLAENEPGVMVLEVRHDPTCPAYKEMSA